MTDDAQLLRRYAQDQSEDAFAELVRRHLGWVYRTALRRTGGRSDLAHEVSQYVFLALAKQAAALAERDQLAGWFYTTIRNAASQLLRAEARRRIHEAAAAMSLYEDIPPESWASLRPTLDQELDRLAAKDREALILRYFEGKSFAQIGAQLSLGEDGARKRVERAVDRLGAQFSRRGILSTEAVLSGMLSAEGSAAAPAGLHASVLKTALSGGGSAGSAATVALLMNATKTTWAGLAVLGLIGIASLSSVGIAVAEYRAMQADRASADAAARQFQAKRDQATATARETADLQAQAAALALKVDSARKAAAVARAKAQSAKNAAVARTEKGKADALDFFSQYGEGKTALLQFFKAEAAAGDALFYRKAGLTPAPTQALANQRANYWLDSTVLLPDSAYFTGPELPDDQLRGILGDQAFQAYKENENSRAALNWVGTVARSAAEGGVPLSLDQDESLTAAITSNSPDYAKGAAVNPANVNWENAMVQAQQSMTPAQWAQVQPTIQMQQVMRELNSVSREGAAP